METKKILTILVFVLVPVLASVAHGKITLTVNNKNVDSITLQVGQSCTVEIVSSDSTSYEAYIGFYQAPIIGDFTPLEIKPEAGKGAEVLKYSTPDFRGYYIKTGGMTQPSPGVHFVFQFEAQGVGETDIRLFDENLKFELDSLHITVIPADMGTGFTYQGRLIHDNNPTDGLYDFEFKLYDSPAGGNHLAGTIDINDLDAIDGYFTVELDFNDANVFNGDALWLDIAVRPADSSDPFATLSPRQELTPTPYALHTREVFVGNRNTFVGRQAGYSNSTGSWNTFVGRQAGYSNETGSENTFVGNLAGHSNTVGIYNTFLGNSAGSYNTEGGYNTFVGHFAGRNNTTGYTNTFLGKNAGYLNKTGYENTFVGVWAGYKTTGSSNTFLGYRAGYSNTTGTGNVFIGYRAGENETESNKLYIANSSVDPPLIYGDFSTGYVGIGTTEPLSKQHIQDSGISLPSAALHEDVLIVEDTDAILALYSSEAGFTGSAITLGEITGGALVDKWSLVRETAGTGKGLRITYGTNKDPLNNTKVMYLDDSGDIGIRTTDPQAGLHLKGSGFPDSFMYLESESGEDAGIRLYEGGTVKWHIFNSSSEAGLSIRNSDYSKVLFAEQSTGNVGIGTTSPDEKLTVVGNVKIDGNLNIYDGSDKVMELGAGLDYAEGFDVSARDKIEPGSVLIIDADNPGKLAISVKAYDSKVAGIVAGAKGIGSGVRLGAGECDHDIALAGRVYCNVDATEAAVEPGDLLTTSATPGYAMKSTDYARAQGAILGKAMESLEKGQKGQILVLVTLQ
jgi:hypothetical protein